MDKSLRTFRFRTESCEIEVAASMKDGVFRTEARDTAGRMAIKDCWRVAPAAVREDLKLMMQMEGCDASGRPVKGDARDAESSDRGMKELRSGLIERLRNGSLRELDSLARNAVPFNRIEDAYHVVRGHVVKIMENRDLKDVLPVLDDLQSASYKAQESYSGSIPVLGALHLRSIRSKLAKLEAHFGDSARFMQIPTLDDSTRETTVASCAKITVYAGGTRAGLTKRAIVSENLRGRVATSAAAAQIDEVVLPAVVAVWKARAEAATSVLSKPDYVSEQLLRDEAAGPVPGMDTDSFIVTYAGRFCGDEIGSTLEAVLADMPVGEDEARKAVDALRGLDMRHAEVAERIRDLAETIESRMDEPAPSAPSM